MLFINEDPLLPTVTVVVLVTFSDATWTGFTGSGDVEIVTVLVDSDTVTTTCKFVGRFVG